MNILLQTKGEKEELCLAIGSKILGLYLLVVPLGPTQLQMILQRFNVYAKTLVRETGSKISAYALVNILQVFNVALANNFKSEDQKDFLRRTDFADPFVKLLAYLNPTVRQETLKFFQVR